MTNILVHQIGSLGDTLVCIPSYKVLRRYYGPEAKLYVLHDAQADLRVTPVQVLLSCQLVDGHIAYPGQTGLKQRLGAMIQVWRQVRSHQFGAVVYLGPSQRPEEALRRDQAFFRACGLKKMIGFHSYPASLFSARDASGRPAAVSHESRLRLERLHKDGIDTTQEQCWEPPFLNLPPSEIEAATTWIASRRKHPERPLIAICTGSNQAAKFWPTARFIKVGQRLMTDYGAELIVVGGPTDRKIAKEMLSAWGSGIDATGQFSVVGSAAALTLCNVLIGLDSGTAHLAATVGVPCITLHADRNSPGQWEPMGPDHVVLRHPVPCGGCALTVCPKPDHPCMTGITVEHVLNAAQRLIRTLKSHSPLPVA